MTVDNEAFVALEESLSRDAQRALRGPLEEAVAEIKRLIAAERFDEARALAASVSLQDEARALEEQLRFRFVQAAMFGAQQITPVDEISEEAVEVVFGVLPEAVQQFCLGVERASAESLVGTVDALTREGERLVAERAEAEIRKQAQTVDELSDAIEAAVFGNQRMLVDVGANLSTSRLVSYGYLAEARQRGISTYQISEVLDSRICPVCRRMHGRTFAVEPAFEKVDRLLRIADPKELKQADPFPKQTKAALAEMDKWTKKDFEARGFIVPPFHPLCRGILVRRGTVERFPAVDIPKPPVDPGTVVVDPGGVPVGPQVVEPPPLPVPPPPAPPAPPAPPVVPAGLLPEPALGVPLQPSGRVISTPPGADKVFGFTAPEELVWARRSFPSNGADQTAMDAAKRAPPLAKVLDGPGRPGSYYDPRARVISIEDQFRGAERDSIYRHEYGHSIDWRVRSDGFPESAEVWEVAEREGLALGRKGKTRDAAVASTKRRNARFDEIEKDLESTFTPGARLAERFERAGVDLDDFSREVLGGKFPTEEGVRDKAILFLAAVEEGDAQLALAQLSSRNADVRNAQDFFGALTNNDLKFRYNHSSEYYRKGRKTASMMIGFSRLTENNMSEAFADYYSVVTSKGQVLRQVLRALAPETTKAFDEILARVADGPTRDSPWR